MIVTSLGFEMLCSFLSLPSICASIIDTIGLPFFSRRGRPLSNGTSDGEDHSTQDTDSQGSSASSKLAALTRAIELVPAVKATAPSKEEDEEEDDDTLQVRRTLKLEL